MDYTKGEWKASDTGHVVVGSGFDMKVIANCLAQPEAEANAHLIAKAPKMYELLTTLLYRETGLDRSQARELIAELEGK